MKNETWVAFVDRCTGEREIIDVLDSWEFASAQPAASERNAKRNTPGSKPPLAVTIFQAADMLNVSTKTIRREINRGNLKATRVGRVWRIRITAIEAYLKSTGEGDE